MLLQTVQQPITGHITPQALLVVGLQAASADDVHISKGRHQVSFAMGNGEIIRQGGKQLRKKLLQMPKLLVNMHIMDLKEEVWDPGRHHSAT